MSSSRLDGFIAATVTPFHADGKLNLTPLPAMAKQLKASGLNGVFIAGTTGEYSSLTLAERQALSDAWQAPARDNGLKFVVHVGSNCQADAVTLAAQAAKLQADAVAVISPSYFKPATVDDLIDFLVPIAAAAKSLPFYFYDIPVLTNVRLPMKEFLDKAPARIPNLAGLKYSNPDLVQLQECLNHLSKPNFLFGIDEAFLSTYVLGVRGAVGSTYNLLTPWFLEMVNAFQQGEGERAAQLQAKAARFVRTFEPFGFLGALKELLTLTGIDCGPVRSPLRKLTDSDRERIKQLHAEIFS
jgi:N-acetylneuraminate lyase